MSGNRKHADTNYRWKDDLSSMEYKCPECGNWVDMDQASPVFFNSTRPACSDCFSIIEKLVSASL